MKFEYIWKLMHLLWLIPLFGILVYYASYRRKNLLKTIFGANAGNSENTTLSYGKRYLKLWLLLSAIIFACFAIARPIWGWRILPFSDRGRDILILLDVSKSMNSEDVKPSRLKHAKLFIRNLIKSNPGDRFGLISFAGSSFLECPLTVDKTSLFQELDELNTDSIPLGGTNIEAALKTALQAFKAAEGGYRAIVLITDGDELYGDSTKAIAELKQKKIPLFVVGIGDPKGDGLIKMTTANGKTTLLRDSQGKLVKSRLNEAGLKRLSDATGGIYVRSTETQPELDAINKRVHALVPKEYSKGSSKRPIERFHYPLAASVLLLLIWFAIGERKSPRTMLLFATLATASLLTPIQLTAQDNNKLLTGTPVEDKSLPPASASDVETKKGKKNAIVTSADIYNRALLAQKSHKISEAVKLYKKAINMSKVAPEVRSKAFQNLGVISHNEARAVMQKNPDDALKILDKAEVMYKEAMRSAPKRKSVVLNQQKLIDDRKLAKQIKKKKEEMKKKQQQAQKKTKEAHDQQKKENQQKKQQQCNKKQNNQKNKDQKQDKQQQQKQSCQNKQNQQQNKNNSSDQQKKNDQKQNSNQNRQSGSNKEQNNQNKQSKGDQGQQKQQNKQNAGKQQQNSGSSSSAKTEQKIKEAEQACNDLKKTADQHKRQDISKQAAEAEKELKKAEEEHKKGNGDKAEEHLKKALEKLQSGSNKNKDNKNSQKNKQSKGDQGEKDKQNQKNGGKQGNQKKNGQDRKLQKPQQDKQKGSQGKNGEKKAEKPIDPRQAAALLDLMANDEKTLLDKIKENQKRNARVKKVLKDW